MLIEELLLEDYGDIPKKIGSFLLRKNSSSLLTIKDFTKLSDLELRNGLSILIQRRFVNFFIFEKSIKYRIDSKAIKRRLYFPIYMKYVIEKYSQKHAKYFSNVLLNGIYKDNEDGDVVSDLLNANILQIDASRKIKPNKKALQSNDISSHGDDEELGIKIRKTSHKYLIVNYGYIDEKIYEEEMIKYVTKRYNDSMGEVLRAVLKCDVIDRANILKNLENTKILISENGTLINDKENVNEYLRYLCFSNILSKGMDASRTYFINRSSKQLKMYKINLMLNSVEHKRLINMIYYNSTIDDKDITMHSLLSVNRVKRSLFELQRLGLILQKCNGDYKAGPRVDHSWYFDIDFASKSIIRALEEHLVEKIKLYNSNWDLNYFMNLSDGNENVWISDIINLSIDHLIFSLD